MKSIKGNIYNHISGEFEKGILFFENVIKRIHIDTSVLESVFILPGLIDAHVHIESTMLNPLEYSREV